MKQILLLSLLILGVIIACSKEEEMIDLQPDAGNSFLNVENDGYFVTLNASPAPEGQVGTWRIYNGGNGRFDDVHDPHTKFYGEPGETYLLGWELNAGEQYEAATINVSFKPLHPVLLTEVEDTLFDNISLELKAEAAKFGAKGYWEIVEGINGEIVSADSSVTAFIGDPREPYTVRWVLTYGSKEASQELSFVTDSLRANAGEDNLDITTFTPVEDTKYYNMDAVLPAGGTGVWELIEGKGGKVYTSDNPYSVFEGKADTVYTLTWKVSVDGYESIDTLKLRFRGKWGMWVDERDNQSYRYVRLGKLEWLAENFNYAAPWTQYGRNFYYGQTSRADIRDGKPVETEEDRKFYGRLYNYYGAKDATPEGWRLPTRQDFKDLHVMLGGQFYFYDKVILGGETGLDINFGGAMSYSNNILSLRDIFFEQEVAGYYVTNYLDPYSYKTVLVYYTKSGGFSGASVSGYYSAASVRYVRDVK